MIRPLLLSTFVLLAGCARSEEARYAQVDNNLLPAVNAVDQGDDDELALGSWQTGLDGDQPVLEFGPVGAPPRFSLSCDDRRNLLLQLPGAAPGGDLPNMLVTIGSETRRFAVAAVPGTVPTLRATLPATDPFLRVLTGAAVRIEIRVGDTQPLVMPPSPAIATYAQQCASGMARSAATPAAGNSAEASASINVTGGNAATGNAQ